jgi:hypothetical protein
VILDRMFRAAMLPRCWRKRVSIPIPGWQYLMIAKVSPGSVSFSRAAKLIRHSLPGLVSPPVMFGGSFVMGWFVNINRFSLHSTYRNRLVRAYLGAPRTGPRPAEAP